MSYRKNLMPSDITPSEAHKATVVEGGTDCISRQVAKDELCKLIDVFWQIPHNEAMACIDNLPSVQPKRAKGHWIDNGLEIDPDVTFYNRSTWTQIYICSECGQKIRGSKTKFCHECGADMCELV